MSDFDTVRGQLRQVRDERDTADADIAATRAQLQQLAIREAQLQRVFEPDDREHVAARAALEQERARLGAELERGHLARASAVAGEVGLVDEFAVFSDPVTGIERLDDSIPILMMPVRLETRFKTSVPATGAAAGDQLWVRIYPDDCWIDTFDEALTTAEVEGARRYWTSIWEAGGHEDQERGAWRTLASAHGSGRAAWIVQAYQPGNLGDRPTKALPQDVVLTVVVEAAPAERAAVAAYWTAVWHADGDAAATDAARTALEAAAGAARAAEA